MAPNKIFALIFLASLLDICLTKSFNATLKTKQLKIAIAVSPPNIFNCSTFPTLVPSKKCRFPGFDAEYLGMILTDMGVKNYSFFVFDEDITPSGDYENGSWTGIMGMIQNETFDTIAGGYQRTEIREEHFDFSYPLLQIMPTFIVKKREETFTEAATAVFRGFSEHVWLTVAVVFFAQIVCLYCVDYVHIDHGETADVGVWSPANMYFSLFRMIMMQCNQELRHPTITGNLLVVTFGIVDVLLVSLYQGLLLTELIHPTEVKPFRNSGEMVQRIADKEFSLITFYTGYWYFQDLKTSNEHHFVQMRAALRKNPLVVIENATQVLEMVAAGKYILPADTDSDMRYFAKLRFCDLTFIYDGLPSQNRHYLFKKGSPWLPLFNDATINQQSFALYAWESYFGRTSSLRDPNEKPIRCPNEPSQIRALSIKALTGLACLFLGGAIFAWMFFAIEYVSWQLNKRRPELFGHGKGIRIMWVYQLFLIHANLNVIIKFRL